jgi:hypothetical protein
MVDDDFSPVPPVEVRARIDELVTHYARVPAAS